MDDSKPKLKLGRTSASRLCGLSDGVLAIVMTVLILNITVPHLLSSQVSSIQLWDHLTTQAPAFVTYLISFLIISRYWYVHAILFKNVETVNNKLVKLNALFLLTVSFLPFPTMLAGIYTNFLSAVLFNINLIIPMIIMALIAKNLQKYSLADKANTNSYNSDLKERYQPIIWVGFVAFPIIACISIVVAYFMDPLGKAVWFAFPILKAAHSKFIAKH